ncbi:hypothetical protein E4634_06660 [Mangrovimicrobium sediminis]|uniref:Cadmium transporter n=1 Tax=Mangrovimicrobium sediminis TaxID=2562682 RepID=A0A4Z0M632_9GAMM|nr:cadmium resistance transporter [Haliea sp. SAOS-164]TGD74870.1 hypothetical protein E4634_06660 [Haliea sp. SAOS-164]
MIPGELAGPAVVVAAGFIATNLDNLLLLVVLMGAEPERRARHRAGYLLACTVVLAVASLGSLLGSLVDPGLIGYLGVIPLAMGLRLLVLRRNTDAAPTPQPGTPAAVAGGGMLATALLMLGNSADSLAIFIPLAAESTLRALAIGSLVFLACATLSASLAGYIAAHPELGRRITAIGEKLVPLVMICAGAYILADTASDTLRQPL